mgnify:CR=1 FL=1
MSMKMPTPSRTTSETCPVCNCPRPANGEVCSHWVGDMLNGHVEWDESDLAREFNEQLREFFGLWWRTIPKPRWARSRVRRAPIPPYLRKAWADGVVLNGREKSKIVIRLGNLRPGVHPCSSRQSLEGWRGLYADEEGKMRLERAIDDVRRAIEVIEEVRDDILFDLYFDECIKNGMDYDDICRDLDFEQWRHDHWLLSLTNEEMGRLVGSVTELAEKTRGSTH